ncbi:hypothetical protein GCM10011360_17710 [Primorskyibacter flagellatus]|uniref:Uncharacterized protein n=1 Tax=Primorskyibacter flagellatus TaxID=1387277 RepID=A0A917A6N3_9RHOB|nr:hypothetical protein [Primorskyibacter flagellatus]GGE30102.1 hypothetical protein GCM10011360_17710 [Primorskyibacter flagellatus]
MLEEANRIKDRLRACRTADEVRNVADEERETVLEMAKTPEGKTQAIQIANLKAYTLDCIKNQRDE